MSIPFKILYEYDSMLTVLITGIAYDKPSPKGKYMADINMVEYEGVEVTEELCSLGMFGEVVEAAKAYASILFESQPLLN